jgi:hypothetical protein
LNFWFELVAESAVLRQVVIQAVDDQDLTVQKVLTSQRVRSWAFFEVALSSRGSRSGDRGDIGFVGRRCTW